MQRSLLIFQNSLKSKESVRAYTYSIKKFLTFYKLKDFDLLLSITTEKLQIMIEDYVMELKRKLNPNTIPSYVNPVKLFIESNDIDLNWRKIRRLFPAPVKATGDSAYSTEDVRKMLDCTPNLRNKTLIHFLASTGCRIGAIPALKLKHLTEMPLGCKAVQVYEDSMEEHYTFLTPEASKILDDYLGHRKKDKEYLTPESPLFRTTYSLGMAKAKPMSKKAMQAVIDRAASNAGIRHYSDKKKGRYPVQLDHGFRKRFNTILKTNNSVNPNLAEKMMGHSITIQLDNSYLKPSVDRLFEEYVKAVPELTVSESERQKPIIELQKRKISELESKDREIENLKEEFRKDHEIVKDFAKANEWFQYYVAKLRGNATKEDDEKFNERYNEYIKSIPKEDAEWINAPEIKKMLKEKTAAMIGS